jgi:hypothetical protein
MVLLAATVAAQSSSKPASSSSAQTPRPAAAPLAGQSYKASLETSETLFSLMAALQSCAPAPAQAESVRAHVREELAQAVAASEGAQAAQKRVCRFAKDHEQSDSAHDLAQYISLALYLSGPPNFAPTIRESDLPPDASFVLGIVPLLREFYSAAGLHDVWQKHQPEYDALVERLHQPVADMILRTDLYLKLQLSGYLGHRFAIFIEPLVPPGEINARNYGDDYFLVVSGERGELPMQAVRHTYLHYVLDPYALRHGTRLKKLDPILLAVATAPMDENFKHDASLLVTESLIRAIEARTMSGAGKEIEHQREQAVEASVKEGFVLTRYFYDALVKFERDPAGLKDTYSTWIYQIDVGREKRRAEETEFAKTAAPELLRAPRPQQMSALDLAEQKLAAQDAAAASKLAQQALADRNEDPARALFILARAAAANGDMPGAQAYFERTIDLAREPRVVAWSHIYLGRIFDIRAEREAALAQYRAALAAGDIAPDTKTAAERGLAQPYAAPAARPN